MHRVGIEPTTQQDAIPGSAGWPIAICRPGPDPIDPAANPLVLRGHEGTVLAVAISRDNHWLVTGSADNTARLWDLSAKDPAA